MFVLAAPRPLPRPVEIVRGVEVNGPLPAPDFCGKEKTDNVYFNVTCILKCH